VITLSLSPVVGRGPWNPHVRPRAALQRGGAHPKTLAKESPLILHPDIPEEGPPVYSPAAIDAAGFFVGGPVLAKNAGWLKLIRAAYVPPVKALDTREERIRGRQTRRDALRARRARELADVRAMLAARCA
jgi:hypothetical protein